MCFHLGEIYQTKFFVARFRQSILARVWGLTERGLRGKEVFFFKLWMEFSVVRQKIYYV